MDSIYTHILPMTSFFVTIATYPNSLHFRGNYKGMTSVSVENKGFKICLCSRILAT